MSIAVAQPLRGEPGEPGEHLRVDARGFLFAEALRDRQQERPEQQVALHRELLERDDERAVREVLELEVGVEVAVVVVPAAGLGVGVGRVAPRSRRSATLRRARGWGAGRPDRTPASISTVQWQCGIGSAGTRGGRWIGRTCARGFVAPAVASKVGSSIAWHMPVTYSSPIGSTSISAPQCASQNSPWFDVEHLAPEVHELVRRADVELQVLHDRRDVAVREAERALGADRVHRARAHPLDDRDVFHHLARPALVDQRHADAVLEMAVQQPLAPEHRERPPGERGQVEVGIEGTGVVVHADDGTS